MAHASFDLRPSRGYGLLLLFLAACGYGSAVALSPAPTLLVHNRSMDPVAVYLTSTSVRLGNAYPGASTCIRLPRHITAGETIVVRPLAGQRHRLPSVNLDDSPGWALDWGNVPVFDSQSLRPAPRC